MSVLPLSPATLLFSCLVARSSQHTHAVISSIFFLKQPFLDHAFSCRCNPISQLPEKVFLLIFSSVLSWTYSNETFNLITLLKLLLSKPPSFLLDPLAAFGAVDVSFLEILSALVSGIPYSVGFPPICFASPLLGLPHNYYLLILDHLGSLLFILIPLVISSNLMALILCICWWFSDSYLWNSRLVCPTAYIDTSTYISYWHLKLNLSQTKLLIFTLPPLSFAPLVVFHVLVNSNFLHLSSCSGQKSCPWLSLTRYIWPIRKSCQFCLQNIARLWPFFITSTDLSLHQFFELLQ